MMGFLRMTRNAVSSSSGTLDAQKMNTHTPAGAAKRDETEKASTNAAMRPSEQLESRSSAGSAAFGWLARRHFFGTRGPLRRVQLNKPECQQRKRQQKK